MTTLNSRWVRSGCIAAAFAWILSSLPANSAELVVYGSQHCEFSQKFIKEAAKDYGSITASKVFPLRIVDIKDGAADITLTRSVDSTPTFVFADRGQEIARFIGYPGRENFFRIIEGAADAYAQGQSTSQ